MKQNRLLKIVLPILLLGMSFTASAYDFMVDGLCYNKNSDGTSVTVTYEVPDGENGRSNYVGDVVIPELVTNKGVDYRVTAIGDCAFRYSSELTSVTIPASVTKIDQYAFIFCSGLAHVEMPNSVASIGRSAFKFCESLTSIILSSSLTEIGDYAFESDTNLSSIEMPNKVRTIGNYCFNGCKRLQSIILSSSLESIGDYAFQGSGLTSVYIPALVTSIGSHTFQYADKLESIAVDPDNAVFDSRDNSNAIIETNNNRLVVGCVNTIIPTSVTTIGELAFRGQHQLRNLIIPFNVTSIERYVIAGAENMEHICVFRKIPIKIDATAFAATYPETAPLTTLTLHVPKGSKSVYANADVWKQFSKIVDDVEFLVPAKHYVIFDEDGSVQLPIGIKPMDIIPQDMACAVLDNDVVKVEDDGLVTPHNVGLTSVSIVDRRGFGYQAQTKVAVISHGGEVDARHNDLSLTGGNLVQGLVNEPTIVPVYLQNTGAVKAFSLTVALPERVALCGELADAVSSTERTTGFEITAVQNPDSTITVMGVAVGEPLPAGDGPVVNLKVATQWQNTYTLSFTSMTVTTPMEDVKTLPDATTHLVIQAVRGDMNGDGRVDAFDALYIYHLVSGLAE